jgi:hypothetical protein
VPRSRVGRLARARQPKRPPSPVCRPAKSPCVKHRGGFLFVLEMATRVCLLSAIPAGRIAGVYFMSRAGNPQPSCLRMTRRGESQ